uniref:Uncharacterized protein n=1 Tax=Glossina pallidipes TaxID=7398 RepID=A0A1A9ZAG0_GLOPL
MCASPRGTPVSQPHNNPASLPRSLEVGPNPGTTRAPNGGSAVSGSTQCDRATDPNNYVIVNQSDVTQLAEQQFTTTQPKCNDDSGQNQLPLHQSSAVISRTSSAAVSGAVVVRQQ